MPKPIEERIAVSTWSVHREMGTTYPHDLTNDHVGGAEETYGPVGESLLDLPAALHNRGFGRMELVSFHLPSRDPVYLGELKSQLAGEEVVLQTLLIDAGDITDPVNGARDARWIAGWIEVANALGAENARIIAGKQAPTPETLDRSVMALKGLADGNAGSPVRLVTENWHALLPSAKEVNFVLDRLEGKVGLLADFGNWKGPGKYDELEKIIGRAELTHAKAFFPEGKMDTADFGRILDMAEAKGYAGPYTLIFENESPGEWHALDEERAFVIERVAASG